MQIIDIFNQFVPAVVSVSYPSSEDFVLAQKIGETPMRVLGIVRRLEEQWF